LTTSITWMKRGHRRTHSANFLNNVAE